MSHESQRMVEIQDADLLLEAWSRPSAAWVGTTHGVKMTHKPTGLIAVCDATPSQYRNREIARAMLRGGIAALLLSGRT
ncbi:protein of unknown function (plasmid) [Rhodovastum atsumiense]|nr:protein of unknown function [Rhodovastum atsumiense]